MKFKYFAMGFLIALLPMIAPQAAEPSNTASSVLPQNPAGVKSDSDTKKPKKSARIRKKDKTDYWTRCQKIKGKLFKGDLDDSVYPKEPLMTEVPGYKPVGSPCGVQPDARSAGVRTKCKF